MGIIDQKRSVFGSLAAINTLSSLPKFGKSSSFSSINNSTNSTDFLIDLLSALAGGKAIKDYVVDTITHKLPDIEQKVKDGLKSELKKLVSCDINPGIPTWFQHGGAGIELKVTDIDFYDLMKTDPQSTEGSFMYTDVTSGVNSTDFNTYLYSTIQAGLSVPGTATNWKIPSSGVDILQTTFTPNGTINNNVVKYTTSPGYANKKLSDFNNDYIDSLSLFGNPHTPNSPDSSKMVTLIIEDLFGSISSSPGVNKSKKQIQKELEIQEVLTCILESEDSNITDNFFTFDNPTLARIDRESNNRRNGIRELETCGNLQVQLTTDSVSAATATIVTATTKADETTAVTTALDDLAQTQAGFSPNNTDKITIESNFFIEIIKKFQRIIMTSILTPEFVTVFAINQQIVYGNNAVTYDGPIEFMKKNRVLVKSIGDVVKEIILGLLLALALKLLTDKLKEKAIGDQIEKGKSYVSRLLSYTGVPPSVIAQIRGII